MSPNNFKSEHATDCASMDEKPRATASENVDRWYGDMEDLEVGLNFIMNISLGSENR